MTGEKAGITGKRKSPRKNFLMLNKNKKSLGDFSATWCQHRIREARFGENENLGEVPFEVGVEEIYLLL